MPRGDKVKDFDLDNMALNIHWLCAYDSWFFQFAAENNVLRDNSFSTFDSIHGNLMFVNAGHTKEDKMLYILANMKPIEKSALKG